jgi:hypothetical protein
MIAADVFLNPLNLARLQSLEARFDCAMEGMPVVLARYLTSAGVAGRLSGGFEYIGPLVTTLARTWRVGEADIGACDAAVEAVLSVAQACLKQSVANVPPPAIKPAVQALCWQLAWTYSTDYYRSVAAQRARANTVAGITTTMDAVLDRNNPYGNPYHYSNSGYTYTAMAPTDLLYRGETRSPRDLFTAGGFTGRYIGTAEYQPWFNGASNGCTISFTSRDKVSTSLNAGGKAAERNSGVRCDPAGAPPWLATVIELRRSGAMAANRIRGYVYEVAPAAPAMRLTAQPAGAEECYLGVPASRILQFWVLLGDNHTVGPFPFDDDIISGAAAPMGAGAISAQARELA